MLRQNLGYKILALLLAIFLWFYVTISQRSAIETRTFTVPVELRNLGKEYVAAVTPARVRLILNGQPDALDSPSPPPEAYVDLRHPKPGQRMVKVAYILPAEARLARVEPPAVKLAVEAIIKKALKVEVNVVGTPPPGYVLGEPEVTPAIVTVSGVSQVVAQVGHVVVNVDANYAGAGVPQTNPLRPVNDAGDAVPGVELSHSQARVALPIQRVLSYETVPVVVRAEGEPAPGYRIASVAVQPPVVTIAGERERLSQVKYVPTAPVDIAGAAAYLRRAVPLALPDGVTTVSETKVQVSVRIEPEG